ncbi:MAG: hypothetical protein FJ025_02880 [Chloroflexi bacterium]|nr:hypothetical protein [Chloroflexota bacterium]
MLFQIHFIQVKQLFFHSCKTIIASFWEKHAGGRFLFVFTSNYSYLLFMTIEWSLERKPKPGERVWPKIPKQYFPHLLVNRGSPTNNDRVVLSSFRLQPSDTDPHVIYNKVLKALKSSEPSEPLPKWFDPQTYKHFGLL